MIFDCVIFVFLTNLVVLSLEEQNNGLSPCTNKYTGIIQVGFPENLT